ncbi:MAG: hypothetical protein HYV03_06615 [Deltaproteobacteria bacterium]|nr:hypothetical protein [Deltaproteobacteria bacterium]
MVQPLLSTDFNAYDTVPDGRLYLADFEQNGHFDTGRFDELVSRYIATDDRTVRGEFRNRMEYPVWKRVADEIGARAQSNGTDHILVQRMSYILKNEFPNRKISGSVESESEYNGETENGDNYVVAKTTRATSVSGNLYWKQPLHGRLLYTLYGTLKGIENQQGQERIVEGHRQRDEAHYFGNEITADTGLRTSQSDAFKLSFGGNHRQFYNPPSDHLQDALSIYGTGELRDIKLTHNPLSLKANASHARETYTAPPPESGLRTKGSTIQTGSAEATYRLSSVGMVLYSDVSESHVAESYGSDDSMAWSAAALLQYTWDENHVQGGIGYGGWSGTYTNFDDEDPVAYRGKDVHGRGGAQVKVNDHFSVGGSAKVKANESEGTFQGWYPSWNASVNVQHTPRRWTNALTATYFGHRINLNNTQEQHGVEGSLSATYRPVDWLKMRIEPSSSYRSTGGYKGSILQKAKLGSSAAYNFTQWDPLWLWVYGGGYYFSFHDDTGHAVGGSGWWAGGGLSVDIN